MGPPGGSPMLGMSGWSRGKPRSLGAGLQFRSIWGLKSVTMSVLRLCAMKMHRSYYALGTELERPRRGGQALQRQ